MARCEPNRSQGNSVRTSGTWVSMVSGQWTQGKWMNRRVRSPSETSSPSATVWTRPSGKGSRSVSMPSHLGVHSTVASGKRSSTRGSDPEWSCSAWLATT